MRLLDGNGNPYLWPDGREAIEDRFPLHQVARTADWPTGEVIQDVYTLHLPPTLLTDLEAKTRSNSDHAKSPTLLVIIYDEATALEEGRIEILF